MTTATRLYDWKTLAKHAHDFARSGTKSFEEAIKRADKNLRACGQQPDGECHEFLESLKGNQK